METENLIFVVDDSEIFLSLFSRFLSQKGNYKVKSFSDGSKMLRDLYLKPKAILLDYYLDGTNKTALNGNEVMEIMKIMHEKPPVIVFSGMCNTEKIAELKGKGMTEFISKEEHNFLEKTESALRQVISQSEIISN